jgi:thiol-disulfide isomerase/thioredoxin
VAVVVVLAVLAGCGASASDRQTLPVASPSSVVSSSVAPAPSSSAPTGPASGPLPYYDSARDAGADIESALKLATADHKRVLIDFGADWCPDCRVLAALYNDPTVRPELDAGYHLVVVDVGHFDRNLAVSKRFGDVISGGIPALVVVDPAGHPLIATKDGAFANARTMKSSDVLAFLRRWAPPS